MVAAKKTFAKYMPGTLPSWLAGGLDNDKSVKQAARTGLLQAFEGEQKQHALWVKYAAAIIDYARDALLEQSVITLSDERTTTPDDASSKYSRAAGGSLQLIIALTSKHWIAGILAKSLLTGSQTTYPTTRSRLFRLLSTPYLASLDYGDSPQIPIRSFDARRIVSCS